MFKFNQITCPPSTSSLTVVIFLWISCAQSQDSVRPVVTILQGTLEGLTLSTYHQREISGFLGIPYAEPPVGNLRFANPVPAGEWEGTRNASVDMNMCPQVSNGEIAGDEDCLYLNVYTPQLPGSTNHVSLLPVMVYIHGGAFIRGSSRSDTANPAYLLDEDVVLVAFNYRLDLLGFLSTGDDVASGNWGLKDQIMALQWVQQNIAHFGGDPSQVTLFGISAGSVSVHLLTLSDLTIGLFHRYITESGVALAPWAYQPRATYASRAFELGEYVGCSNNTSDSLISCLRRLDFVDLMAANPQFLVWETLPGIVWTPTDEPDIEGAVLTDSPANLFANGTIRDEPWICGVTRDEGLLHSIATFKDTATYEDFLENMDSILPEMLTFTYQSDSGAAWVNGIKSYYFNDLTANMSVHFTNLTLLVGDALFFYPAYNALRQQRAIAKSPQYLYVINYRGTFSTTFLSGDPNINYGVSHGDDTFYLFPPRPTYLPFNKTMSERDFEIVDTMVELWTSFAINGTPTTSAFDGNTTWIPYSMEDSYLQIGDESEVGLKIQNSFLSERMQFWADLTTTSGTSAVTNPYANSFVMILLICFQFVLSARRDIALV